MLKTFYYLSGDAESLKAAAHLAELHPDVTVKEVTPTTVVIFTDHATYESILNLATKVTVVDVTEVAA